MTWKKRTATLRIFGFESLEKQQAEEAIVFSFTFPETYMEFRISDIDNDSPNACYVKIYGISKETYKMFENKKFEKFKEGQKCDIYLGYDRDEELLWNGVVSRVKYEFSFGQQYMEILLTQNMSKFHIQRHSICIQRETNTYEALGILCEQFGYRFECQNIEDFQNITLRPITLEGNFKECLKDLLNNKMGYYVDNDTLITYSTNKYIKKEYILLFNNGLIAYPTLDTGKIDEGDFYVIKHKAIPSMRKGARVKIPIDEHGDYSVDDTGKYVTFEVEEYLTSFGETADSTEMKCRRVDV